MKERPSLHALAVFVAVLDHGTMTAAAEEEGIAQPAISAHVRKLEAFFGVPLMERAGRRVRPTAAGQLVGTYARQLLMVADELGEAVADLDRMRGGRLVVGASATVAETWLPTVLGQFRKSYPAVSLAVQVGSSDEIHHAVLERQIGLGIVGRKISSAALKQTPVFEDRIVFFASANSQTAALPSIDLRELANRTLVLREPGSATRGTLLNCLAEHGIAFAETVDLGSNEAVKRAVSADLGIGALSALTLEVDLRAGTISLLVVPGWDCRRHFWLIQRADRRRTQAEIAFETLLLGA